MPGFAGWMASGREHHAAGRLEEAAGAYQAALGIRSHADAWCALGQVRCLQRRFDDGIQLFEEALRLRPEDLGTRNLLGSACADAGRLEEAVAHHEAALRMAPDAATHTFLGVAWGRRQQPERAAEHFESALRLAPQDADVLLHYGIMLYRAGRLEAARERLEAALERAPDAVSVRYHLGVLRLRMGDLARGWAGYEARLDIQRFTSMRRDFDAPRWDGTPLQGRTLLVHAEQGFGDAMQFVRFLAELPGAESGHAEREESPGARSGRVVLECSRPLIRLLRGCAGVVEVVERGAAGPYDVQVPLISLPYVCGTTLETIPARVPYLRPDSDDAARWNAILAGDCGMRVGVAWSGNPQDPDHAARSVPAARLASLAGVPGVTLYSLQKGAAAPSDLADLTWALHDFAETAALVASLDLVVTVDTAVAHLAGGMAKPVWLLLSHDPDWRWMAEREDSPWYPTMRIFRQRTPGAWEEVMGRVAMALEVAARDRGKRAGRPGDAETALRLATIARMFVPPGARVLEVGPVRGMERFLPEGACLSDEPTLIVSLDGAGSISLGRLRSLEIPVVAGFPPGRETSAVAEAVVRAGFRIESGEHLGDGWLILRLQPGAGGDPADTPAGG